MSLSARGSGGFGSLGFLDVVGEARSTAASVDFVFQPLPRRIGILSVASVGFVRSCIDRRAQQERVPGARWWFEGSGFDVSPRRRRRGAAYP
jgi:hypothetical protein